MNGNHLKIERFGSEAMGVELFGDPSRPEPTYFRVKFPGGEMTISRCDNGDYWCHIDACKPQHFDGSARILGDMVDSRIDCLGKHANEVLGGDFSRPDTYHVAVRISPKDVRHGS